MEAVTGLSIKNMWKDTEFPSLSLLSSLLSDNNEEPYEQNQPGGGIELRMIKNHHLSLYSIIGSSSDTLNTSPTLHDPSSKQGEQRY